MEWKILWILWNGGLKFEGEYSYGERNGKGKEYNKDGILNFEGEYLNGEKNGKGKEYDYNGKLKFEGEYLNGKKWNGIIYDTWCDQGNQRSEWEYINGNYYDRWENL